MFRKALALFALFLCLESHAAPVCKEGFVNLNLQGDDQNGFINGYFTDTYVNWYVSFNRVHVYSSSNYTSLEIFPQPQGDYVIQGWMWNRYVSWRSFGNYFNFWNYCF